MGKRWRRQESTFMQKHQHPNKQTALPKKLQVITEAPVNLLNGSILFPVTLSSPYQLPS